MRTPSTAASVDRKIGQSRQNVAYHVPELEKVGLLRHVGQRQKGNFLEQTYVAVADTLLISPSCTWGEPGARTQALADQLSLGELFAAGDLDAPLTVISRIPPVYPLHAKQRGIKGWVQVRFVVQEDGRVTDITIQESQPAGVFDASVLRSVAGWRFKPGTVAGTPVKAWAETTIRFELE